MKIIFLQKIISKYSNVHFAIKLHPRTKVNRFEGLIPVIKNNNAPWELILWNRIISKKSDLLQLSIACGTMMSDKFLYDYEGPKMLLARLFLDIIKPINGYRRVNEKLLINTKNLNNHIKNLINLCCLKKNRKYMKC